MSRLARAVAVGFAHHVTQRGNNCRDVLFVDDDRQVYLKLFKEHAGKYALELIGYRLLLLPCFWPKAKNTDALRTESPEVRRKTKQPDGSA